MRYDYHMFEFDWQKILLWAGFIFLLGAALLRQETGINQDLGRHLRLGEMIVAGGEQRKCALYSNCLTYTYPDYPFVNHHWGSEVIFHLLHKMGGFPALIILKAIVLGLAFTIIVRHAMASKGPTLENPGLDLRRLTVAIALIFFSIQMMADRLTTRPEIFGYLLFSILFWILDKKDLSNWRNLPNWMLIPILMIIWVNLHISFVFGLILIWIWAGSQLLASLRGSVSDRGNLTDRHAPRRGGGLAMTATAIAAASTMVTIFNPAGWQGAVMPLAIMKDYGYTIVENMTPFFLRAFKPQPEYWIYAAILVITTIIFITSNKKPSGFSILSFYLFSIFPLIAVRHLAFFGLIAPVILTPLLVGVSKGPTLAYAKVGPYQISVLVAGGILFAALTNPVPLSYAKLPPLGLTIDKRHEEAVKFVKNHDLQGRMWNNYDIGSFLEWSLPEHPTFVDGRPEAFPAGFFQETYIPMQESREKWDEMAQTYDIQWAFVAVTDATPWFQKWRRMIQTHEGWKLVYIDKSTAILVRQDEVNQSIKPTRRAIDFLSTF